MMARMGVGGRHPRLSDKGRERPELQVQLGRLWCRSTGCREVLNDAGLLAGASALQAETGDNAPASFQARRGFSRAYAP
jgi:hypothetical protein